MTTDFEPDADNGFYYEPTWTNTSEVNLTNQVTEGWVMNIYPAEDLWFLTPYTGEDSTYSNLKLSMTNTG